MNLIELCQGAELLSLLITITDLCIVRSSGIKAKVPDSGGEAHGSHPAITWLKIASLLSLPHTCPHNVRSRKTSGDQLTNTSNLFELTLFLYFTRCKV